ncbi:hypothetical protein BJ166DRAFT_575739 [Pestalotiopsis sp. NC0098]|nr:hypothetical protein BJ166DRAFT_575739 [Pestalotiopsis sp. NC0098]
MILTSDTGSGKTTQIPQFLLYDEFASGLMVACTQPRRLAAISVARRVAEEMDVELGTLVGYNVRFDVKGSAKTRLGYMTDGKLLASAMSDPLFSRYCCIVIDEAHERTIPSDLLLALLKHAITARDDLKIVIMSATMDASKFQSFFGGEDKPPMIHMSGNAFPVKEFYIKGPYMTLEALVDETSVLSRSVEGALKRAEEIQQDRDRQREAEDNRRQRELQQQIQLEQQRQEQEQQDQRQQQERRQEEQQQNLQQEHINHQQELRRQELELQQQDRQLERRQHELERTQQEQDEREKQQRERPHQELEVQLQLQREELQERQEELERQRQQQNEQQQLHSRQQRELQQEYQQQQEELQQKHQKQQEQLQHQHKDDSTSDLTRKRGRSQNSERESSRKRVRDSSEALVLKKEEEVDSESIRESQSYAMKMLLPKSRGAAEDFKLIRMPKDIRPLFAGSRADDDTIKKMAKRIAQWLPFLIRSYLIIYALQLARTCVTTINAGSINKPSNENPEISSLVDRVNKASNPGYKLLLFNASLSKNNVIMWATAQRLLDTMVTRLGIHPRDIGVILPYKAGILHANNKFSQSEHLSSLTAVTIDSVQGADKKYVVICLVCNQGSGPGFVSNKRRLTVALSRQMQHIIVVGDQFNYIV